MHQTAQSSPQVWSQSEMVNSKQHAPVFTSNYISLRSTSAPWITKTKYMPFVRSSVFQAYILVRTSRKYIGQRAVSSQQCQKIHFLLRSLITSVCNACCPASLLDTKQISFSAHLLFSLAQYNTTQKMNTSVPPICHFYHPHMYVV